MDSKFKIEQATLQDVPSMARIVTLAWAKDPLWQAIMKNTTPEGEHEFICSSWLGKDFSIPGTIGFKITDPESNNIIAWTRLSIPATLTPSQQTIKTTRVPYSPGMNETLFAFLEASSQGATYAKLGFDHERDFMRQGTYVDPRFQHQGLGARLAKHLNVIADEHQAVTWGAAGPAIVKLMGSQGFEVLEEVKPGELRGASICVIRRVARGVDLGRDERIGFSDRVRGVLLCVLPALVVGVWGYMRYVYRKSGRDFRSYW